MAEQKIFAGPKIRRIRNSLKLTQTNMASELGISPSYLNLIERNQRPLTVQILLKLASTYEVDLEELRGQSSGALGHLKEIFSDPLLSGELPSDQELVEIAEAAPNAATGIVKLFKAYLESQERLTDLKDLLAKEGHNTELSSTQLPSDEVRALFESRPNYHAAIDEKAESFSMEIGFGQDLLSNLKEWLRKQHNIAVKTLPVHVMPHWRRRFDRHSMRLFLSERLSPFDQLREVAIEASLLLMEDEIEDQLKAMNLTSDEAIRIAKLELARYAAHAIIMPYEEFRSATTQLRYDIDVLSSRFSASFEQVANRLTMMQKVGASGVPFFMIENDHAGNRFRRAGAKGFPQLEFGGKCPKLSIYSAFSQPGQILVERVLLADGNEFMTVARTLESPKNAYNERFRRTAILLGCQIGYAEHTVYGDSLNFEITKPNEIGTACRLCERQGCMSRVAPPITRPIGLDTMVSGFGSYDF